MFKALSIPLYRSFHFFGRPCLTVLLRGSLKKQNNGQSTQITILIRETFFKFEYGVYHKCGLLPFRIHVQLIFLWPDDDSPMQRVCLAEGSRYHKLWTGLRLFLFIGSQLALFIASQFVPMNTLWCHQTWQAGRLRTKWRFIFWEDIAMLPEGTGIYPCVCTHGWIWKWIKINRWNEDSTYRYGCTDEPIHVPSGMLT